MIRASRLKFMQTIADLAAARGVPLQTFRNSRLHLQEGHPAPISSPGAKTLLWDSEQTDAYHVGEPVPTPPADDSGQDLLDRHEAAQELGVATASWSKYKQDPALSAHTVRAGGVEHWPRAAVHAFAADRRGRKRAAAGRPVGHGDTVPREQLLDRIAELLAADPARTAGDVVDALGVSMPTAQQGLATMRGRRIADLLQTRPELPPRQAALELGYPTVAHRRALQAAEREQHARRALPYLQQVADTLTEAGYANPHHVKPQHLDDGAVAAAVPLADTAPAPALVWHEHHGWRTAENRRHPIGKKSDSTPVGQGIRYLDRGRQPEPAEVLAALKATSAWAQTPRCTPEP